MAGRSSRRNCLLLNFWTTITLLLLVLFCVPSSQCFIIPSKYLNLKCTTVQSTSNENDENKLAIMNLQNRNSTVTPLLSWLSPRQHRRSFLFSNLLLAASSWSSSIVTPQSSPTVAAAATVAELANAATKESDMVWPLGKVAFSLLPIAGTYSRRATVEEEVIAGRIWTHDQIQGVVNVNVPVRQVVIKLSPSAGGGLLVHNPVAPTPQLLSMMDKLQQKHGAIRHIILGTVALEHKATFGAFAQNFPKATVWVQPGQYSFPLDLPVEFLGVSQRGLKFRELPMKGKECTNRLFQHFADVASSQGSADPEWIVDLSYEVLGPLKFKSVGSFSETAFYHQSTKTLIVTDAVVSITADPPPIIQEDPRAMLFHARDFINDYPEDTYETRQKGWRRMVQFGFFFFPSQIDAVSFPQAVSEANNITDAYIQSLGKQGVPFNLYPWKWKDSVSDIEHFNALTQGGKLIVPPILTKLILDREPEKVQQWVDAICNSYDFTHVISSHINNYVPASPKDFKQAFAVLALDATSSSVDVQRRPLAEDLALLQKASDLLTQLNVVDASRVCDGEAARIVGRFASNKP